MKRATAEALRRLADRLDPSEDAADRRILRATRAHGTPSLTLEKERVVVRAATQLEEAGHEVIIKNGGLHLQIDHPSLGLIDVWPTSGNWWIASRKLRGHGITHLVHRIGVAA